MKLALIIAGRLRQIWKPYVFVAVAAMVAVVVVAILGVTPREAGVALALVLVCVSLLATVAGVLLAARTEEPSSEPKDGLSRRRLGGD
jgi:hypothetical protein